MGFYKALSDWGEEIFNHQRESMMNLYGLKEISLDETTAITAGKSVKPVHSITNLKTQEAQN
jgi:hypothetical protein